MAEEEGGLGGRSAIAIVVLLVERLCLRFSAGLTRLFSCENAKVANNFAEISSESTFQLSSNRLTLSIDEARRMH